MANSDVTAAILATNREPFQMSGVDDSLNTNEFNTHRDAQANTQLENRVSL